MRFSAHQDIVLSHSHLYTNTHTRTDTLSNTLSNTRSNTRSNLLLGILGTCVGLLSVACPAPGENNGSDAGEIVDENDAGNDAGNAVVDLDDPAENPPEGAADVENWINQGFYLAWHCEEAIHDQREPSPHGRNRICSNNALANASANAPFPVGSAGVKELYDDNDALVGFAIYRKAEAVTAATGNNDGANWYWYEKLSGDVLADGRGNAGVPLTVCVDCHSHAPEFAGAEFVFAQIR